MTRTLNQRMSDAHEADMAELTDGVKQKGSGNQWHREGDTKNGEYLTPHPITSDCKATLGKSIGVSRDMWRKLLEQTWGQQSALFLRYYRDDRLRDIDVDLAVVDVWFFKELLEDARKWQRLQKGLYFCPTAEEVESETGGGFDQCCDRPELHVALPDNESTAVLSQILSDRQRAKVKQQTLDTFDVKGCDCCR